MAERYNPIIDNYLLSIPAEEDELWRNELQLLYDSMKLCVTDPIAIDGQYYDVHDDLSEEIDNRFDISEAEAILGLRKIVFADLMPIFLDKHKEFLSLVEKLSPGSNLRLEERTETAKEIANNHKNLIDAIKIYTEEFDKDKILNNVPDEFGLRRIIESEIACRQDGYINCFRYPRCKIPTEDYSAALGDNLIMAQRLANLKPDSLIFIPADDPYIEDIYPGSLSSYKARIRFVGEVMNQIDLIKLRESKMVRTFLERTG